MTDLPEAGGGPETRVRPATARDAETIVGFIRGLAEFEREPPERVRVTAREIVRDGFGDRPLFEALIAEADGEPVGFALFFANYSTWEGTGGIHLEDLFVLPERRGEGIGRALLARVAHIAASRGAARLELSVLDWNPARSFYERAGMSHQSEWLPYRMDREAIVRLAEEGSGPTV